MQTNLLIPGPATSSSASVWAGLVSLNAAPAQPAEAWIEKDDGTRLPIASWDSWPQPGQDRGVVSARVVLSGLPPRSRQRVTLVVDGRRVASAFVSTLPDRLPTFENPFRIMFGSCFCSAEDRAGRVGRRFKTLPDGLRPDLKILSGDQVYLDSPFYKFLIPHTKNRLTRLFLTNYAETWGQSGDVAGFHQVLADGANLFTSDDHEFWNNAPFPSFSLNTLSSRGRQDWLELARGLYSRFQTDEPAVRGVEVGDLKMLLVDTRIERSDDRTAFLSTASLERVVSWIDGLTSPGLLVIGQPLFAGKAGFAGRIADWNLPDFDQYATLCRALMETRQPIVLLTGDVHFGRVSGIVTHRGVEIAEIISSPMTLVTGGGKRTWHPPPERFPADPIPGIAQRPIQKLAGWSRAEDHFITIELWESGGGLSVRVRAWEVTPDADSPNHPVFEHTFKRSA